MESSIQIGHIKEYFFSFFVLQWAPFGVLASNGNFWKNHVVYEGFLLPKYKRVFSILLGIVWALQTVRPECKERAPP